MTTPRLEHVNVTVSDPHRTAALLADLFGWERRWEGEALNGGYTIHVGTPDAYLALYAPRQTLEGAPVSYDIAGGLNHVGVTVEDIDAVERKVIAAGYAPFNHADYDPGRRFYFRDADDIEWEVVSYG